jgi:hypothetical protein
MKISELLIEKETPVKGKTDSGNPAGAAVIAGGAVAGGAMALSKESIGKFIKTSQRRWKVKNKMTERKVARMMEKWGTGTVWLFRILGMTTVVYQCYSDLANLEEDYERGDEEFLKTQAAYEACREYVFGVAIAQFAVQTVHWVAGGRIAMWIFRVIRWVTAGATAGFTAGASVAALIATEAMFVWFETWIGSEEGKRWISETFLGGILRNFGKIPDGAISKLTDHYSKANTKKDANAEKTGKPTAKDDSRDPDKNDRYVDGVLVTNPDGSIIPGIESNVRVKNAITQAAKDGKPNPLTAIRDELKADPAKTQQTAPSQGAPKSADDLSSFKYSL